MKTALILLGLASALPLTGCVYDNYRYGYGYGGGYYGGDPYDYGGYGIGYYDGYYGPVYDSYYGRDGYYYYRRNNHDNRYYRGDASHWRRGDWNRNDNNRRWRDRDHSGDHNWTNRRGH